MIVCYDVGFGWCLGLLLVLRCVSLAGGFGAWVDCGLI